MSTAEAKINKIKCPDTSVHPHPSPPPLSIIYRQVFLRYYWSCYRSYPWCYYALAPSSQSFCLYKKFTNANAQVFRHSYLPNPIPIMMLMLLSMPPFLFGLLKTSKFDTSYPPPPPPHSCLNVTYLYISIYIYLYIPLSLSSHPQNLTIYVLDFRGGW